MTDTAPVASKHSAKDRTSMMIACMVIMSKDGSGRMRFTAEKGTEKEQTARNKPVRSGIGTV